MHSLNASRIRYTEQLRTALDAELSRIGAYGFRDYQLVAMELDGWLSVASFDCVHVCANAIANLSRLPDGLIRWGGTESAWFQVHDALVGVLETDEEELTA